ncbi:ankyrin repeat-containing domain protein [Mrakia frigida]|uniref:ankyrin repeat domain-containing protein n=1 Tax=Mrakia frigida TaxID=29902 RepID=UPI003FCC15B0
MSSITIQKACLEGQPGLARSLLNANPEAINSIDADGRSALHWAASASSLEVMELLLKNTPPPNLNLRDASGSTPLIVAVASGQESNVVALLAAGADVNATNEKGQTALHYAASKARIEIGRRLIQKGADVSPVSSPSLHPRFPSCPSSVLSSLTPSLLLLPQINSKDRANQHPLHRAATTGSDGFVQLLLAGGKDGKRTRLNTQDRMGNTPLHLAFESGHGSTAVLLIEAGADRDKPNVDDHTPEQLEGLGDREQKKVRDFVWGKVGRPE